MSTILYNSLLPLNLQKITTPLDPATIDSSLLSGDVYDLGTVSSPADTDFIALSQTKVGAGALTLTGAPVAIADPKRVTLTSVDDNSLTGYIVVGLDENGDAQTSASTTGPNNETVTIVDAGADELYWTSITSITADGASTNIESGYSTALIIIDAANGYEQEMVVAGPVEIVFENLAVAPAFSYFRLIFTDAGSFAVELPSGVDYGDSGAPTLSVGKVDYLGLYTKNAGVRWHVAYDTGYAI